MGGVPSVVGPSGVGLDEVDTRLNSRRPTDADSAAREDQSGSRGNHADWRFL
jgi:hypothetical protein